MMRPTVPQEVTNRKHNKIVHAFVIIVVALSAYMIGSNGPQFNGHTDTPTVPTTYTHTDYSTESDHVTDYNDGWTDGRNDLFDQGYHK